MLSETVTDNESADEGIHLYDEARLNNILQWYDQQISLAAKSRELAELKSAIAKARAEETFALVQIARMTAGDPEDASVEDQNKKAM